MHRPTDIESRPGFSDMSKKSGSDFPYNYIILNLHIVLHSNSQIYFERTWALMTITDEQIPSAAAPLTWYAEATEHITGHASKRLLAHLGEPSA